MTKASIRKLIRSNKRNYRKKSSLNLKTYIESGVLELYVLALLSETEQKDVAKMLAAYPELHIEIDKIQASLENKALANAIQPSAQLKNRVLDSIENLQKEKLMDMNDLPLINKFSIHHHWLNLVGSFGRLELVDGRYIKVLRQDDSVTQLLIISETPIAEETHEEEYESFLILSGECKCTVAGVVSFMKPGDFMEIPLFEPHHVELASPQVMAILQHIKV